MFCSIKGAMWVFLATSGAIEQRLASWPYRCFMKKTVLRPWMIFTQDLVILFPNKENWGFKSPFIKLIKVRHICVDLHAKNLSVLWLTVGCKWPNMHIIVRGCKLKCTGLFGLAAVRMKMLNIFIKLLFSLSCNLFQTEGLDLSSDLESWLTCCSKGREKKNKQKKTTKKHPKLCPFTGLCSPKRLCGPSASQTHTWDTSRSSSMHVMDLLMAGQVCLCRWVC